jgi:CRP/FNR family transcriptional regulator, cyclic AMP receptor protein
MKSSLYLDKNKQVLSLLKKIDNFQLFSDSDLESFLHLGKLKRYEAGEVIIQEGEFDCWIYFMISGEADIEKRGKKIDTLRRSGDLFGEMGVVDGEPRSATIRAVSDTLVMGIDGSLVDRKAKENELAFCYTIFRLFSENLAEKLRITTSENIKLKEELRKKEDLLKKISEVSLSASELPPGKIYK